MRVCALIYIVFAILILWIEKMMYKHFYELEYGFVKECTELYDEVLKNNLDIIQKDFKILEKNRKLRKENTKLKKALNKSKNRVAKVIKEEETNGQYRNK